MPQLVKGGKQTYGWSVVSETGRIAIPQEAMHEYGFSEYDKVILMSGSRRSGGFAVSTPARLAGSPLSTVLDGFSRLRTFQMREGSIVRAGGRAYCWTMIDEGGYITLPLDTLREYKILPGDRLLTVRGSGLALGFAVKGPIVDEAAAHAELEIFE
jgi:bifunctional DNA-binding transcriptional regulator/antitoxin component of YhaV-PrlF toxin-antitoxin module